MTSTPTFRTQPTPGCARERPKRGRLKFGILAFTQFSDWSAVRDVGVLVDRLGYDSLWTCDHVYNPLGDPGGPIFEGYTTLAAWAALTKRVSLGLMVGANTFRNPALTVKMATTLDHISGGRAYLGLGAAWHEPSHRAFGIDFPASAGERGDRLDEAAALIRAMLGGKAASARGSFYHAIDARNNPPPIQPRLPILIGGSGERKTLATVARYADAWNIGGEISVVRRKDTVLRRWCDEVGRDEGEIERTLQGGIVVIRDTIAEARSVARRIGERNGNWAGPDVVGPPEVVAERLVAHVELGFHHLYFDIAAPHDRETLERLVSEVKPLLERAVSAPPAEPCQPRA